MRRVLFLDFDGVLHPAAQHPNAGCAGGGEEWPLRPGLFAHTHLLAQILKEAPDIVLMTHSIRRLKETDQQLRTLLGPLVPRFVGATDRTLDADASILRAIEKRGLTPLEYRVLDGEPTSLQELNDNVIRCDSTRGVDDPVVLEAVRKWAVRL
jgi:hypothetical protein